MRIDRQEDREENEMWVFWYVMGACMGFWTCWDFWVKPLREKVREQEIGIGRLVACAETHE